MTIRRKLTVNLMGILFWIVAIILFSTGKVDGWILLLFVLDSLKLEFTFPV